MARESVPPIAELRAIAQPSSVTTRRSAEHWTGHLYMRRISIYGTRLALHLGFSADFVTGVMIVVGLIAVATTAIPGLWSAVVGALLIQLYLGLDCVDGEVARVRRTESARGGLPRSPRALPRRRRTTDRSGDPGQRWRPGICSHRPDRGHRRDVGKGRDRSCDRGTISPRSGSCR